MLIGNLMIDNMMTSWYNPYGGDTMKEKPIIRQQRDPEEKVRISAAVPLWIKERLIEISRRRNQSIALTIRELLEKGLREVSS